MAQPAGFLPNPTDYAKTREPSFFETVHRKTLLCDIVALTMMDT